MRRVCETTDLHGGAATTAAVLTLLLALASPFKALASRSLSSAGTANLQGHGQNGGLMPDQLMNNNAGSGATNAAHMPQGEAREREGSDLRRRLGSTDLPSSSFQYRLTTVAGVCRFHGSRKSDRFSFAAKPGAPWQQQQQGQQPQGQQQQSDHSNELHDQLARAAKSDAAAAGGNSVNGGSSGSSSRRQLASQRSAQQQQQRQMQMQQGQPRLSRPLGVAVDSRRRYLYVQDSDPHTVGSFRVVRMQLPAASSDLGHGFDSDLGQGQIVDLGHGRGDVGHGPSGQSQLATSRGELVNVQQTVQQHQGASHANRQDGQHGQSGQSPAGQGFAVVAQGAGEAYALKVSPDGDKLYVAVPGKSAVLVADLGAPQQQDSGLQVLQGQGLEEATAPTRLKSLWRRFTAWLLGLCDSPSMGNGQQRAVGFTRLPPPAQAVVHTVLPGMGPIDLALNPRSGEPLYVADAFNYGVVALLGPSSPTTLLDGGGGIDGSDSSDGSDDGGNSSNGSHGQTLSSTPAASPDAVYAVVAVVAAADAPTEADVATAIGSSKHGRDVSSSSSTRSTGSTGSTSGISSTSSAGIIRSTGSTGSTAGISSTRSTGITRSTGGTGSTGSSTSSTAYASSSAAVATVLPHLKLWSSAIAVDEVTGDLYLADQDRGIVIVKGGLNRGGGSAGGLGSDDSATINLASSSGSSGSSTTDSSIGGVGTAVGIAPSPAGGLAAGAKDSLAVVAGVLPQQRVTVLEGTSQYRVYGLAVDPFTQDVYFTTGGSCLLRHRRSNNGRSSSSSGSNSSSEGNMVSVVAGDCRRAGTSNDGRDPVHARFHALMHLALDAAGRRLYMVDHACDCVHELTLPAVAS